MNSFFVWGRVVAGLVFAYMGLFKIIRWTATADWMAMKGFPPSFIPILLVGAIAVELGGGLALAFGYKTRWVAIGIALFLIPTNLMMHNFWTMPPQQAAAEQLSFLQNVIIIGGLLALSAGSQQEKKQMIHVV
ncbi:DoxX family protein [Aneurinibacillus sp. REN35]|uniref:DoxX family protein n=1 Tax=Aneurinibacillus sp. REN35 TaxID=3237286 RepID=UPI003526EB9F